MSHESLSLTAVSALNTPLATVEADAVVVGVFNDRPLSGAAEQLDRATAGLLGKLQQRQEITGKPYEVVPLHAPAGIKAPLAIVVGLGSAASYDRAVAYRAAATATKALSGKARLIVAVYLDDNVKAELIEHAVAGALSGCVGQDLYKEKKSRYPIGKLLWSTTDTAAVERGVILGQSVNLTRRLINEPPQDIYPESFANQTAALAKQFNIPCEVWDQSRLEAERCGSLLAVAKGSERPPRLVILEHRGGPKDQDPIALVGKGVTFDSGGLSLKPNDGMLSMKCDMSGAATVVGAMLAIARLKLPLNVIGLVGLVENMPSGTAMKLGDVLKARNGRTIEVQNTDAEGRLVLADVLDVAVSRGAQRIVDLATLTGACVVALGNDVAGAMTNDQSWCDQVMRLGRDCGEPIWQLPMFADHRLADYRELINSQVADIRNVGEGRAGGAITAAKFLEEFVAGTPWVHLDIAGPAFSDKAKPWVDGGASGMFVRTLVEIARELATR